MKILSFLHRRRYRFRQVFWATLGIYMVFTFIGVIVLYVTPATDKTPQWNVVWSWPNLLSKVFSVFFFSFFYFVTLNMFYRLFAGKHKAIQFVRPVVVGLLLMIVYHAVSFFFLDKMKHALSGNDQKIKEELTLGLLAVFFVMASAFLLALSMLLSYLTYLRDEKKQRKILEEQKMQLEIEKSQANLNFLKAQINPHFLHNTLNFLYSKSLPYSPELSEGILTLSDIMRYALGPAAKDGKVLLKDEIEHVRNVIKINQLRFSNNLNVKFEVNGVVNGATIIPFLLITLVENAFKHGDLKSQEHPIDISLDVRDNKLYVFCRNKKKAGPKEISTGIGLDNIKKQLDLAYGRNYLLNVKDEAEFYTTELTINTV